MTPKLQSLSQKLVAMAKKSGACDADAMAVADTGESISVRNGNVESVEREDAQGVGLRAFVEHAGELAFASASTSDTSDAGLKQLVKQVMEMAHISEPDPDAVPPTGAEHPTQKELDAWAESHPAEVSWDTETAKQAALACEDAALSFSNKITNSEGAEAGSSMVRVAYASADGFAAAYEKSSATLSASVIAGTGDGMQRDYAWDRKHASNALRAPETIGREASERTLRRLGASSVDGGNMTVVFEPRVATSLLGHLISAINGRAVLQQRSFLADQKGEHIFPDFMHIVDNPDHPQGLGNRLFDGEGTRCRPMTIIDKGILNEFLTNRYAAGRLGGKSTGHASRGLTGDISIGTSNLMMQAGHQSVDEILNAIGNGLLVTELIGFGVNGVTGDYSRGASGFLIEDGKISRSVQEITIAGNLKDMFANISYLGNDLTWFGSSAVPTVAIANMTVAGQG